MKRISNFEQLLLKILKRYPNETCDPITDRAKRIVLACAKKRKEIYRIHDPCDLVQETVLILLEGTEVFSKTFFKKFQKASTKLLHASGHTYSHPEHYFYELFLIRYVGKELSVAQKEMLDEIEKAYKQYGFKGLQAHFNVKLSKKEQRLLYKTYPKSSRPGGKSKFKYVLTDEDKALSAKEFCLKFDVTRSVYFNGKKRGYIYPKMKIQA